MDDSCLLDASMRSPSSISISAAADLEVDLLAALHRQNSDEITGDQLGLQPHHIALLDW
jgi:hypothetical protein